MITVFDNFFENNLVEESNLYLENANWKYGWKSNNGMKYSHWNCDIGKGGAKNELDISHNLPPLFLTMWNHLNKNVFNDKGILVRCYSNRHTYGVEGFVHTDTDKENHKTCIIYLNKEWNVNWGGETAFFEDDEIIKSVLPKYGRMVVFPSDVYHCARGVTKDFIGVRTTLMFKVKEQDVNRDTLKSFLIKIGADKKKHQNTTLIEHLLNTYDLIKKHGGWSEAALIGGLHSVYSTTIYKDACLSWEDNQIKELFGNEVDRLVRIFSKLDRPNLLENPDGNLSYEDVFVLRCVECANLYDQNALGKYPNLCNFINQLTKE